MTKNIKKKLPLFILPVLVIAGMSFSGNRINESSIKFPYEQAGLTESEAAAHLINRFTFGPTPNEVDKVVHEGLEKWFLQQLSANMNDDALNEKLKDYDALNMSNAEILQKYPSNAEILKLAMEEEKINKEAIADGSRDKKEVMNDYRKKHGFGTYKQLYDQLISQKILRATYSQNQLQEVMTDFWFNHFNISIAKSSYGMFAISYERDALRKNCLSNFEQLLISTAKSPAMLQYLDNARSTGKNSRLGDTQEQTERKIEMLKNDTSAAARNKQEKLEKKLNSGLNENYARELMELHTLGVDGGYTQKDVTEVARVLTGWTVFPALREDDPARAKKLALFDSEKSKRMGFVHEGDFLFALNRHDDEEKTILGKKFPAGGGYDEGLQLFHLLATHPSTAKFISKKLAIHFVSDNPPQSLIDKMAKTFLDKNGDIKQVLLTMVQSPEFWSKDAVREKIKSPFELAISTMRILNTSSISRPDVLNNWITKMGQRIYFYQAPTGFPDNAQYWINTSSLLNRINFGLAVTSNKIPGLNYDLAALNDYKEPESAEKALEVYCKLLLPERNTESTIKRLTPLLNDPNLESKIDKASKENAKKDDSTDDGDVMASDTPIKSNKKNNYSGSLNFSNSSSLKQVVGIILGSPEFQRR
ncbi:MAG: DUF1800 domain-containing protein [Bacteroidetes bacterium]|jgi:uncharacterized protein (DUF1800 family)|nr:DUF1800 domain-containing protein [Bacteroidota bacterium]